MRSRRLVWLMGAAVLLATLVAGSRVTAAPTRQASAVTFRQPVWVLGKVLMGRYLFVHDEEKMAQGLPCTSIYQLGDTEAAAEVVSFYCIHKDRSESGRFIASLRHQRQGGYILEEFQLPNSSDGHGVPLK